LEIRKSDRKTCASKGQAVLFIVDVDGTSGSTL
jgi:hypothetical protein